MDQDVAAAQALHASGIFVVSPLIVGDQKLIGYDPERLATLFPE